MARAKTIGFNWTRPVTDPPDQRGQPGDHRDVPVETALHLEQLGYGYRDGHEPKPKPEIEEEQDGRAEPDGSDRYGNESATIDVGAEANGTNDGCETIAAS